MTRAPSRFHKARGVLTVLCTLAWLVAFAATHVSVGAVRRIPLPSAGDTTLHLVGYMLLTAIFLVTLVAHGLARQTRLLVVPIVMLAYASVDEWTQPLIGRSATVAEWLADLAGAAISLTVLELCLAMGQRFFPRKPDRSAAGC
ncbi:MAG: VanZ family protein [Planctomycetota bacterium]|jgi:VanZ family protein